MIIYIFLALTSILVGLTSGTITSKFLVFQKGMNFFTTGLVQKIPFFDTTLAQAKTFDLIEFYSSIIFSVIVFILFLFIFRKRKLHYVFQIIVGLLFVINAIVIYLNVFFAFYSGAQVVIFSLVWYLFILLILRVVPHEPVSWRESKNAIFNGFFVGFYLLIVLHSVTPSIAIPLIVFFSMPLFFYICSGKFKFLKHPAFLVLIFSFAFPYKLSYLLMIGLLFGAALLYPLNKIPNKILDVFYKIYPILVLFIILYNPLYYFGNFDSIEEGFWAGWLQRSLNNQVIYKDFAAYQPPMILYGLNYFVRAFGINLLYFRLYFHLLQAVGLIALYLLLNRIAKSWWIKVGILTLIIAYSSSLVRNNVEIRIGSAVFPLFLAFLSSVYKKGHFVLFAGFFSFLALLISVETGVASIISALVITILLSERNEYLKNLALYISGIILLAVPIIIHLTLNGSIGKFIEYMSYYSLAFSSGYLNIQVNRPEPQTLLQLYIINNYLFSPGLLLTASKVSIIATIFVALIKKVKNSMRAEDILAFGLAIFTIIISRSALGRSDSYHIIFIWIVGLILIGYLLQILNRVSKGPVVVTLFLLFYIGSGVLVNYFGQNLLLKFETYGNLSGNYPEYTFDRGRIFTNIDVNPKDLANLIAYVDNNVGRDEKIFVFPQKPELYFLTNRKNATSFDTPIAFYTENYQQKMINEISLNKPKIIVYEKDFVAGGFTRKGLQKLDQFITQNYMKKTSFGNLDVMIEL